MADYHLTRLRSSIRKIDDDTIEVTRFENGSMRWVLWFCFALMLFFFLRSWWQQDGLWDEVRIWLDSERYWYEDWQVNVDAVFPKPYKYSPEEHRAFMLGLIDSPHYPDEGKILDFGGDKLLESIAQSELENGGFSLHKHRWISGMNYVLAVVFSFYLAFLINMRPVRFNRKYGVAYTYNFWGFFITDVGPECRNLGFERRVMASNRPAARFDSRLLGWGALVIHLHSFWFPRYRRPWALGTYPALYEGQNDDIARGIRSFMCDPVRPNWIDELEKQPPLRTWRRLNQIAFNFTLRPLFWPKRKTERLIKTYLERMELR